MREHSRPMIAGTKCFGIMPEMAFYNQSRYQLAVVNFRDEVGSQSQKQSL